MFGPSEVHFSSWNSIRKFRSILTISVVVFASKAVQFRNLGARDSTGVLARWLFESPIVVVCLSYVWACASACAIWDLYFVKFVKFIVQKVIKRYCFKKFQSDLSAICRRNRRILTFKYRLTLNKSIWSCCLMIASWSPNFWSNFQQTRLVC